MLLTRREMPVLIVNLLYVPVFTVMALRRLNFEFVLYVGVILLVGAWVVWKQRRIHFDLTILWGLTIWGLLHLAGGNIRVHGEVLYGLQLVPVVLRYDQMVHAFGFGVATLVCHHLLRPYLREGAAISGSLFLLVVLMGCGMGAMNEIVEFAAVKCFEETNVGGYDNTMWDLVFNLIGALLAATWISRSNRRARFLRQGA